MIMHFNASQLWLTLSNLAAARITYSRGRAQGQGKVGNLDTDVSRLHASRAQLDCSGYVQYVVYQGSSHNVRMPQGSHKQQEWLDENGYRSVEGNEFVDMRDVYNFEAAKKDDTVRIAYRATDPALKRSGTGSGGAGVGHVWLVINGRTHECTTKGQANGPWSFDFDTRRDDADALFVLGPAFGFAAQGPLLTATTA
ncbi:hypothetical protein [Aliiruegeria sabulilitoris]|uniref:hypothetical protein n=1 Tax=Aliiruegeria sabulilitoris TaxID=1510458 RepID=UPI000836E6A1|nr:hypothetical protein [Aliiruegeria sabulilitoris]NDR57741.1 hypothetical protein [Pseudoruegeria sp. M32A2M]